MRRRLVYILLLLISYSLFIDKGYASSLELANCIQNVPFTSSDTGIQERLNQIEAILKKLEAQGKKYDTAKVLRLNFYSSKIPLYLQSYELRGKDKFFIKRWLTCSKNKYTYWGFSRSDQFVDVDTVKLTIKDGFIWDLYVNTTNGQRYVNQYAPIALTQRRFEKQDFVQLNNDKSVAIRLNDFLSVYPSNSFIPDDTELILHTNDRYKMLYKDVNLNTLIDLRLYTDALGLFGTQPNGFLQTDARVKFLLHRSNVWNKYLFFFQYLKANLSFSKFDSRYGFENLSDFSRTSQYQKSRGNIEIITNLVNSSIGKKSPNQLYIDFGVGANIGRLIRPFDSATKRFGDTINSYMPKFFVDAGFNLVASKNAGFDFSARCMLQTSPQIGDSKFSFKERFWIFGVESYFHPSSSASAGRIFARLNYTTGLVRIETEKSFLQFQFGYSVMVNQLFNKSK